VLGCPYNHAIDMWSVGAVLAELHTGYVLFQNLSVATMLARITGVLGPFPPHVLARGRETRKYFSSAGVAYERGEGSEVTLIYPKKTTLHSRLHMDPDSLVLEDSDVSDEEAELFVDFVRSLLTLDPELRPSAQQALQHPWLQGCRDFDLMGLNREEDRWGSGVTAVPPPPPPDDYEEEEEEEKEDQR